MDVPLAGQNALFVEEPSVQPPMDVNDMAGIGKLTHISLSPHGIGRLSKLITFL